MSETSSAERYPIEIIQGVEGLCIGFNNYRLVGPKPWGGGTVVKRWHVSLADLGKAIPEVATIKALQAENAELRKPLLSYDEGGLPVELPAWTPVDAERLEELEAAEAEVTTLRTALEKAIEDMQWMFGGWGLTDEDQLAVGLEQAHKNIAAIREALHERE